MPVALTEVPSRPLPPDPPRKLWTREECAQLEAMGMFDQHRVELIDGELISKMGKNRPHAASEAFLTYWLIQVFGYRKVNSDVPINVAGVDNARNEPVPDFIVLKPSYLGNWTTMPGPQDLELVVEVSDSSLTFDLSVKADLYARAEIAEYWVLDIQKRRMIVHREPANGHYTSVVAYAEHELVSPVASPASSLKLAEIFAD